MSERISARVLALNLPFLFSLCSKKRSPIVKFDRTKYQLFHMYIDNQFSCTIVLFEVSGEINDTPISLGGSKDKLGTFSAVTYGLLETT